MLLKGIGVLLQITDKPSFEALEQISESLERAILSCQLNIHNKELQGEVQTVQNVFFSKMSEVWKHALENPEFRAQFIAYAESQGIVVLDEYANPSANSTGGHLDLDFTGYNGKSAFSGFGSQNGKASYI